MNWKLNRIIFFAAIALLLPICAFAGSEKNLLYTVDDVEKILMNPEWVVLDCRSKKLYDAGHIPGAVTLGDSCRYVLRDGTERVKKVKEMEMILGNAGIDNSKHVVVYADAKNLDHATTGFWILEYLGHDKVHFLNGGLDGWKKSGKPVDKKAKQLATATFKAKVNKSVIAATGEILAIAKGKTKNIQLIDSRSEKEYLGTDIRALRGGRIPNTTINIPHDKTYDKKTGIISMGKVLSLYTTLDKDKKTIVYCQTGARATVNYLEMRVLGFKNPAVYDDSWAVYGNSIYPPYPIENEQWVNLDVIGKMKKTIDKMAKEILKLKRQNTKLKNAWVEGKTAVEVEEEEAWMNPLEESGCGAEEDEE